MSTDRQSKIGAEHLARDAFLYVRRSSIRQVFENTESTKRQYALRERAVALGWPIERVHVIDTDLGISGATAADRDGFQRLVGEIANGHAGIVLGLEVSRLARNSADWHRLIELAALTRTLILDEDGIYDPAHFNDRLLLGLKGTMSEAELHVLGARLQGGIRNKARRGELEMPLPIGLVYAANGTVGLDPDAQIHASIRLLFETFRRSASASSVVRRFQREGWQFPRRVRCGIGKGDVLWGALDHSRAIQILHNPRYAGAFAYGRTRTVRSAKGTNRVLKVPREQWQVLIPNAHIGFIDWDEFERNQVTMRNNVSGFSVTSRGAMPREGVGLLQGRVLCGKCGSRMRVRYQDVERRLEPYYQCTEALVRQAGKLCQSVRGRPIDEAISALVLRSVAPAAIEVAVAVQGEIAARVEQAGALRLTQLERARYDAELARRRYMLVDPANRMVADALESDWNARLRRLDTLQQEHDHLKAADQVLLSEPSRERIKALAHDFGRVWNDVRVAPIERKRMLGLLIEDITLHKAERVSIHVRWRGGRTESLQIDRPKPMALIRKTLPEVVRAVDALLDTCTDREAAARLNEAGHRNWKGQAFTFKKVTVLRYAYQLKSRFQRLRERGLLTGVEMARQLGVCPASIHHWGRAGYLKRYLYGNHQQCLYEPVGNVVALKGSGGRYSSRPPTLIPAPPTTQGAL